MKFKLFIARSAATVLAVISIAVCMGVLIWWIFDLPLLLSTALMSIPMPPASAIISITLAIAILLNRFASVHAGNIGFILSIGAVAALGHQAVLAVMHWGHDPSKIRFMFGVPIGIMSPIGITLFFLIACGLVLQARSPKKMRTVIDALSLIVLTAAAVIIVGYWYGAPLLYGGGIIPVPFISAVVLIITAIAVLFRSPEALFSRLLTDTSVFSSLIRYLVPLIIIVILFSGWHDIHVVRRLAPQMAAVVSSLFALLTIALLTAAAMIVSRRAGKALAESEERLTATLRSIGDGVISTDDKGNVIALNSVAEKLTGWETRDAFGKPLWDVFTIINAETRSPADDIVMRVLREGVIVGLANHTALISKDGTERQIADSAAPIRDREGNIIGTVLVFRDVTEEYGLREEIRKNEVRYRSLFDGIRIGAAVYEVVDDGRDFIFRDYNRAGAEMENESREHVIGKSVFEVRPDVERFGLIDVFRRVWKTGVPEHHPVSFYDDGAVTGWFENYVYKLPSREIVALYEDITERRQAETELRERDTMLQCLWKISQFRAKNVQEILDFALTETVALSGSTIGYIYHYDEERKEFTLNSWSRDVMKECRIMDPQTVYSLEKTGIWGEAVRQRKPIIDNDFSKPNALRKGYPEGHVHLDSFMTVPIFSGERIVAVAGVGNKKNGYSEADVRMLSHLMDSAWKIVERFEAVASLKKHEEALLQADKLHSLGVLATGIVHEINQPLTAITMGLDNISLKAGDAAYISAKTAAIKEYVTRITKIVEQVRTFAREKHDDSGTFTMNTAVRNVLGMVGSQIKGRNIRFVQSLDDALPPVSGDLFRFEQVVLNLITNARHAVESAAGKPEGAEITIRTYSNGRTAVMQIRDNGVGISDEVKRNLFTPFYTTKPVGEGTGLGLSIVYGIIKGMGGTIDVVSEEGRFTEFTITLAAQ